MAARFNPGSSSARVIELCIQKKCVPLVSWKIRREIESVMKRVKVGSDFDKKFSVFLKHAKTVKINRELPLLMEDPDDNKLLNCALFGKADYLVTSDEHLLKLGKYLGVEICKPSQFVKGVGRRKGRRRRGG
jgi:putative PIN family toxin of toxin-antitoxin system